MTRGNRHNHLGMIFTFEDGDLCLDVRPHVKGMLKDFPIEFGPCGGISVPAGLDSFKADSSERPSEEGESILHETVAQQSFLSCRGGPDMQLVNSVLCGRA